MRYLADNLGGYLIRVKRYSTGFSLIEMLIVLFIVALVAVLTWPSYRDVVLSSRRAEAKSMLLVVSSDQERYFSRFNRYIDDSSPLNSPASAGREKHTTSGLYTISVDACADGHLDFCFVATATPLGSQSAGGCTSLSIDNRGVRGAKGSLSDLNECWAH